MEARASTMASDARMVMDSQIADLKRRRDLHWSRAQTAVAQLEPIEKAQPVGERSNKVAKARPVDQQPAKAYRQRRVYRPVQPVQESVFQRIGRLFQRY